MRHPDARTLVVHTGGIGDFVLACPALAALGERSAIEVAGNPTRLCIASAAGIADAVHDLDRIAFHSLYSDVAPELLDFFCRFTRVCIFLRDDGAIARRLQRAGLQHVEFHPGIPPHDWHEHASAYYAHCLGVEAASLPGLRFAPGEGLDVLIHPGSGSAKKNWPLENFVEVGEYLRGEGRNPVWLLGPAEEGIRLPKDVTTLRCDDLARLAGQLAASRGYVGNDSGLGHLAAAAGCPTVAIFGPTDPAIWAPRGPQVVLCTGSPWPSVAQVRHALCALR